MIKNAGKKNDRELLIILQIIKPLYSNRAVGKSGKVIIQLTDLLEYIAVSCYMHLNMSLFALQPEDIN